MGLTRITSDGITDGTITGSDLATNIDLVDNQKLRLGTGNDLQIYHDGNSRIQNTNNSCDFRIQSDSIELKGNSSDEMMLKGVLNGAVELYYDNVKKLDTQSTSVRLFDDLVMSANNIQLNDNAQIQIGNAPDMRIYHDGSHSFITNTTGDLTLVDESRIKFRTDQFVLNNHANDESIIYAAADGEISLYHNGSKKFDTTSAGVHVTGSLNVTTTMHIPDGSTGLQIGDSNDLKIFHDGSNSYIDDTGTGDLNISGSIVRLQDSNRLTYCRGVQGGAFEIYFNNALKFDTTSSGVQIAGKINFTGTGQAIDLIDNQQIRLGTGDDLQIYHDGSNSFIKDAGTGSLVIQASTLAVNNAAGSEQMMKAVENGAVELNYDGSKKLETTSVGAKISSSAAAKLNITSADNSSGMINLGPSSNDDSAQIWYDDYANGMFVRTTTNTSITVYTNNTQRLVLQNDGHLRPYVDSTYDLGTSSIRWRNVYADTYYGDGSNLTGINTDLVSDTSPQLGGSLDTNSKNINFGDSTGNGVNRIRMGASNDCQMYHDTNNTLIDNATGYLGIRSDTLYLQDHSNGHAYITAVRDGAVGLRYDNSQKLETTSSGVTVTGTCTATSFSGDGSNLSGVASFPSGTKMLFVQSSAPTGWTKQTGFDNRALRLVSSGSLGGGGGGSNGFSNVFNNSVSTSGGSVSNHTLSVSQIPSHNHTFSINNEYNQLFYPNQSIVARGENKSGIDTYSTSSTGSGSSHNHGFSNPSLNLNVSYVDVIYASKD